MTQQKHTPKEPTSIVAIGVGNRMRTYLTFLEQHPQKGRLVAIAEPDPIRRQAVANRFGIPEHRCFVTYDDLFASGIPADAAFICTPENDHFRPCMLALDRGCHVLLEKPAARSTEELEAIRNKARLAHRFVAVCHVLRHHPVFMKLKELVESGRYGRIISITHTEYVGLDRMCHSYVRGSMNSEEGNNPMLLAKCCHDIDFLLWLSGSKPVNISSFGSLRWFRHDNAPAEASQRCVECSIEQRCPYSAVDLYWRRHEWISNFDVPQGSDIDDVIRHQLRYGPYGRCVFHCDNDVVDNQVVTMQMADGSLISLHMDIFTRHDGRRTEIRLTEGEIISDGSRITATRFIDNQTENFEFDDINATPFHGGADLRIVEEFLRLIASGNASSSSIDDALKVQRVCEQAELFRRRASS